MKVEATDIYCYSCGVPTEAFKKHFRLRGVLGKARESIKLETDRFLIYNLLIGLVLLVVIFIAENNVLTHSHWLNYGIINVSAILAVPLLMIPFVSIKTEDKKLDFRPYLKLVLFTGVVALSFFLLKVICQGDAILNIVRLVLVLWGIACFFPSVFLILKSDESVFRSIRKAYIAGKYLRWHQFSLCVIISAYMLVMIIILLIIGTQLDLERHILSTPVLFLVLVPFPYTMRLISHVMMGWHEKLEEFKLFGKDKDY
jgi:hypothetical protein